MMKNIPIHKLQERISSGFEIGRISDEGVREMVEALEVHRDNNYIFLLLERGEGSVIVDFVKVILPAKHIYYIAPGQVHHDFKTNGGEAYFIAVAADLIPKNYRGIFEQNFLLQQTYGLKLEEFKHCRSLVHLLYDQFNKKIEAPFYHQLIQSLLHSFIYMFAGFYTLADYGLKHSLRPVQITAKFKRLVADKIRVEKSPSFYACELHISQVYLNEVVKSVTGFNVTYWLMNELMLEAKRLLMYSQADIKEIANQLGYEDHAYFSRVFKKQANLTPSKFRNNYLK